MPTRTIEDINKKLKRNEAVVFTADEFKKLVRKGKKVDHVDVVTTATVAVMSGTTAVLSIPFAERGKVERIKRIWLNGVPAHPGPCPNERLGIADVIVYGTACADRKYGGGHLFRELVEGEEITLKAETDKGDFVGTSFTLDKLDFARIIGTRTAFKNYMAFTNSEDEPIKTIFSVSPLKGNLQEATVCGCGEINPLQNNSKLETTGIGTRILVNGSQGYVIGTGTRSSFDKPNISIIADMKDMKPEYMGGFNTSVGPECITSVAIPIPVLNDNILDQLKILDEHIKLPIADINTREPFNDSDYSKVWQNTSLAVRFISAKCDKLNKLNEPCRVEKLCPLGAFSRKEGIDPKKCFHCGACATILCDRNAFTATLGSIKVGEQRVPIILRQSDRLRALGLAKLLKQKIVEGEFELSSPVQSIVF